MTVFTNYSFPSYTGGKSRTTPQRLDQFGAVNVAEMPNFAGDGVTDDIIPLRAAVAKALADGKGSVIIPAGASCAISDTLGLWYESAQTTASYSLALIGQTHGNHEGQGTKIKPTFDGVGVMIGPGQEMIVEKIGVVDVATQYRGLQNSSRVGIGVAGGSGGCSGFQINDCHVYGMYYGVYVGELDSSLGDSGYIHKLNVDQCQTGIYYSQTQNYIQNVDACTISAKNAIRAGQGHNVNVRGGNYSGVSGYGGKFAISSVSAITKSTYGNGFTYTFTAHVDAPDANVAGGILDDGCVDLPHFGLVPVIVTGYNSGTQVISLQILRMWGLFHYQGVDLKASTDFDTINQANATLYLAERLTTFLGPSFNVSLSSHLENASGYTRLLDDVATFDTGTFVSRISDLYCNWDPALPQDTLTDPQTAKRNVQKSHPFINLSHGSAGLILDGVRLSQAARACINIDIEGNNIFEARNCRYWNSPNVRSYTGQGAFTGSKYESYGQSGVGYGLWEPTPFMPSTLNVPEDSRDRQVGWARGEFWGWFPGKDRAPRLAPSQVTTVSGVLPTFTTGGNIGYEILCGGTHYSIGSEVESNAGASMFLRSNHKGYSHGQNLTTTNVTNLAWSFYGTTPKLTLNVEAFERMFPGLVLSLSHASISGGTPFEVIVTGLFYDELYVTVMAFSGTVLPGTAGTQYTGTTIAQAAYSITTV